MPKTIRDVEKLGYSVGFAHGSVEAEELALEGAQKDAHIDVLAEQAATVTTATVADLAAAGKLPNDASARRRIAEQIAVQALDHLTVRANRRSEFHARALEVAREMPDVFVISGPGVTNIYVACKTDGTGWDPDQQAILDALADPDAHKERRKQERAAENP